MATSSNRRYYQELWKDARRFQVDMAKKQWCDLWHQHVDLDGRGNANWLDRRRHLSVLLLMLCRAKRELASFGNPYQLFAAIYPSNSSNDAIYVHTENPNGTRFPVSHEGAIPIKDIPPPLMGKVSTADYEIFALGSGKERCFLLVPVKIPQRAQAVCQKAAMHVSSSGY